MGAPNISFDKIILRYGSNSHPALCDLSLKIRQGERIGICGRTGSGKSSLLSALLRLHEIESGNIHIGDVDIKTIPRQALRKQITLIPQEAMLLCCSLREVFSAASTSSELIGTLAVEPRSREAA